jgi:trans-aconitate methyltransferase
MSNMEHFISNNEQNLLHWNIILRWIIRLYMLMPKLLAYVLGLLAFTKPNNYSDPIFPQLSEVMYDSIYHAGGWGLGRNIGWYLQVTYIFASSPYSTFCMELDDANKAPRIT